MKLARILGFCGCLLLALHSLGQVPESDEAETPAVGSGIRVSGYVKYLQSSFLVRGDFAGVPATLLNQLLGGALHDHLLHHRLNVSAPISGRWHAHLGWRNRFFYGDQARLFALSGGDYAAEIDRDVNDWLDLSFIPLRERAWVAHSVLDRLYLEWQGERNEIRVGRQRVNWGVATLWNPNDLLHAYSFIDFDYEERPGADALRWIHYRDAGRWELVFRPAREWDRSTMAALYRGSRPNLDYQLLAAWHQDELAVGGGWETDLGLAAWKGELTAFLPPDSTRNAALAWSTDWTRTWDNGLLFGAGYLLNTAAQANANLFADFRERLSARNLYPYRHSFFVQGNYTITPLLSAGLATVFSPDKESNFFLSPLVQLSLATDWDLDLTGQILVRAEEGRWESPIQAFFLRLRRSY